MDLTSKAAVITERSMDRRASVDTACVTAMVHNSNNKISNNLYAIKEVTSTILHLVWCMINPSWVVLVVRKIYKYHTMITQESLWKWSWHEIHSTMLWKLLGYDRQVDYHNQGCPQPKSRLLHLFKIHSHQYQKVGPLCEHMFPPFHSKSCGQYCRNEIISRIFKKPYYFQVVDGGVSIKLDGVGNEQSISTLCYLT